MIEISPAAMITQSARFMRCFLRAEVCSRRRWRSRSAVAEHGPLGERVVRDSCGADHAKTALPLQHEHKATLAIGGALQCGLVPPQRTDVAENHRWKWS